MNTLKWKQEDGISWITLNRPELRNAVNYEMMDELDEILHKIEATDDKIVVMTGSGNRAFCSGGDLSLFHSLYTEAEAYGMLSKMGKILKRIFLFPKPTVALLNGVAVGGGCELITACDFRIARKNAKFGFVQGSLEITTGWGGGTMLFERLKPHDAMTYLMTSQIFTAEKGFEDGFIHHLIDDDESLEDGLGQFLTPYLKQSANVLSAYKKIWLNKFDLATFEENVEKEIRNCSKLWEKEEHHAAVRRFLNK